MANCLEPPVKYVTSNGAKPRYDGNGTEFGLAHRDLGPGYLMLDIDRLSAKVEMDLEIRRENEGFIEYRRVMDRIVFVALFEVKAVKTEYSQAALNPRETNSLARLEIARRLGSRLFVVFATRGGPPFEYWEINTDTGDACKCGVLNYTSVDRAERIRKFWRDVLHILRDVETPDEIPFG